MTKEYRIEGIGVGREFEGDPTDTILDVIEDAGAVDAVASASAPLRFVSAMFTLDAEDIDSASARGGAMLRTAFAAASLELSSLRVSDQPSAETIDLLETEISGTEIAHATGLSRERVRQLAAHDDFPAPVRTLGRSALWTWHQVVDYFACRGHDPSELRRRAGELAQEPRRHDRA